MNIMSTFIDITPKKEEIYYSPVKVSPFVLFDKVFNHTITTKEIDQIPEFLLHTLLSGNQSTLEISSFLTCSNMDIHKQVKFIQSIIPKGTKIYYPKKPKIKEPDLVYEIEEMFNVNELTAIRYAETMTKKDKKYIRSIIE